MKILRREPEETENPYTRFGSQLENIWHHRWKQGKLAERQAWQVEIVDVDLDEMVEEWRWCVKKEFPLKSFTQYLKEQLAKPQVEPQHDKACPI